MALFAQFLKQYDASDRAQFVEQYFDSATEMVASDDDFDSAIGTSSITSATADDPSVTITPYDNSDVTGWMMTYTRFTGCDGKTPVFTLDFTNYRGAIALPASPWQMVWRYVDDSDPGTGRPRAWNTFDNNSGDPTHVFSNSTAFSQDAVEVAVKPRWRYLDTQQSIAYAALSSYASELPSAVAFGGADNVFNTVTLTSGANNSAAPTTLNQYGIKLDDTSSQPAGSFDKLNVIILLAQHSSEDQGHFAAWETVLLYLNGVGTVADWFRQHCRLYVYDPNPAGRYYGAERWTQEQAGDEDPNRAWDDTGSEQINAVVAAITADVPRTDILWDFHGDYRLHGNGFSEELGIFQTYTIEGTWRTRVNTLLSPVSVRDLGAIATGSAQRYGNDTLSAQLSQTLEYPIALDNYPAAENAYKSVSTAYVEAVKEMVAAAELTLTSTSTTITASGAVQGQVVGNVTLTQGYELAVSGLIQGQGTGAATLTQAHELTPNSVEQGHAVGQTAITQGHEIAPASVEQVQAIGVTELTQAHLIVPASLGQAQAIAMTTLIQAHVLGPEAVSHVQSLSSPSLTAAGDLVINSLSQATGLGAVELVQANILTVDALEQGHALASVNVSQAGELLAAGLAQTQGLAASTLIQAHQVAVSNLAQAQTVEQVSLALADLLDIDDLFQGQTADQATLTQAHILSVSDLTQAQLLQAVNFGGLVVGSLKGEIRIYALIDGALTIEPALKGNITIH